MSRKLFLHKPSQSEAELVEVEESITVQELISRHGADGHHAWAQDGEELIITTVVVEVIEERGHVHVGPHAAEIEVTVRYGTGDRTRQFTPGTRVLTVLKWAESAQEFNVPESQRGDLELFAADSKEPLDKAEHIGDITTEHHLRLTLGPVDRPQG